MQDMYDKVSIHIDSPMSQNLEGFTSFYNPCQLLQPKKTLIRILLHQQCT